MDVLACPWCEGRLRLIALIEEAAVIGRILRHLGVLTEIPVPRPRGTIMVTMPDVGDIAVPEESHLTIFSLSPYFRISAPSTP